MRLPRLTTRRLMVLVMVAGLLLAARRHHGRCTDLSSSYSRMAGCLGAQLEDSQARGRVVSMEDRRDVESYAARARFYRRAAWRPWMPVPPDPLEPE